MNSAGTVKLRISGERGRQIDLQFGEYFAPDGEPDTSNICFYPAGYSQRDMYILKGEGEEIFEPVFTYHGFRYCVVLGITEQEATADLLTFVVQNSALREIGSFGCSDGMTNKLQAMTRNSDLSNFYYFPTDCYMLYRSAFASGNRYTDKASDDCKRGENTGKCEFLCCIILFHSRVLLSK